MYGTPEPSISGPKISGCSMFLMSQQPYCLLASRSKPDVRIVDSSTHCIRCYRGPGWAAALITEASCLGSKMTIDLFLTIPPIILPSGLHLIEVVWSGMSVKVITGSSFLSSLISHILTVLSIEWVASRLSAASCHCTLMHLRAWASSSKSHSTLVYPLVSPS